MLTNGPQVHQANSSQNLKLWWSSGDTFLLVSKIRSYHGIILKEMVQVFVFPFNSNHDDDDDEKNC